MWRAWSILAGSCGVESLEHISRVSCVESLEHVSRVSCVESLEHISLEHISSYVETLGTRLSAH